MWGSDLSGIEARLLGHFTYSFDGGDMARELLAGDIHTKTAVAMGISRNTAKTIRYALIPLAHVKLIEIGRSPRDRTIPREAY